MRHLNVRVAQKSKELTERQLPESEKVCGVFFFFFHFYSPLTPSVLFKDIAEILGVPVKIEVVFSTFRDENELNFVNNVSCSRVAMALRCITAKDTKDKVAQTLKKVRLLCVPSEAQKSISYENGVLEMHCAYSQGLSGAFSDNEIRALLSK